MIHVGDKVKWAHGEYPYTVEVIHEDAVVLGGYGPLRTDRHEFHIGVLSQETSPRDWIVLLECPHVTPEPPKDPPMSRDMAAYHDIGVTEYTMRCIRKAAVSVYPSGLREPISETQRLAQTVLELLDAYDTAIILPTMGEVFKDSNGVTRYTPPTDNI